VQAAEDRSPLVQKAAVADLLAGNLVSLQEMYFQLLSEAPVAESHPLLREHVLLRLELLVVVVVVGHVHKMVIQDNLFIKLLVADVLQFAYKVEQMI
jgi:hypothetical protein